MAKRQKFVVECALSVAPTSAGKAWTKKEVRELVQAALNTIPPGDVRGIVRKVDLD